MPSRRTEERAILGAHLEGPFLSEDRAGAHPVEHLRRPDLDLLASFLLGGCAVTTVTLAPELPRADELIDALVGRNITVSLGHTDATAPVAHAAFDQGARTVTHLFNAMRPFGHRDPGVAGTALARADVIVQLIADGVHLAPETILATWRAARGRIALVSDLISAGGLGDGAFRLGTVDVTVEGGVSRLADGTLAGAVRPLAWGLRMLVELGVPIVEAVAAVTRTPARVLGRDDIAVLRPGAPADLVVLDDDFAVATVLAGWLPRRIARCRPACAEALLQRLDGSSGGCRASRELLAERGRVLPGAASRAEQQADGEDDEHGDDGADQAACAKAWRVDIEGALAGMRRSTGAEHDSEREEVGRGDEERHAEQDQPALPARRSCVPRTTGRRGQVAVNVKP